MVLCLLRRNELAADSSHGVCRPLPWLSDHASARFVSLLIPLAVTASIVSQLVCKIVGESANFL